MIREEASPELLALLEATTLGTNGACYRHLDTPSRILEIDDPLFLSLERNGKTLGNITFCRRGTNWYIRYFAFASFLQAGNNLKNQERKNSILKDSIEAFFREKLGKTDQSAPEATSFYAYIYTRNDRSRWMSENFGFRTVGQLATQSFSRARPKQSKRLARIEDPSCISSLLDEHFGNHQYFDKTNYQKLPCYSIQAKDGEILSFARISTARWEIQRLPGKNGKLLTRLIPYIPVLRKLIYPPAHTFLVPESVYVKGHDPKLLTELLEGILFEEKRTLMLWWTDFNEPLYKSVRMKMRWGIVDRITGVSPVDVVARSEKPLHITQPFYVKGIDLI